MKQISKLHLKKAQVVVLCVVLFVVAALVYVVWNERTVREQRAKTGDTTSLVVRGLQADDHVIGNRNAPIKLFVYSDFSCPYCRNFFDNTVPQLQRAYGSKIVIVHRHLPLPSIHPRAVRAAEASECAAREGGEDMFWYYGSRLYHHADFVRGLDDAALVRIASDLGLDSTRFSACLEQGLTKARVQKDMNEAAVAGLDYTPITVLKSDIRATIVKGSPFARHASAIDYLLGVNASLGE